MQVATMEKLSVKEYLAWEAENFEKHEYINGEVYCMAGAKYEHNRIMSNINTAIGRRLDNTDCFLLSSEMRVKSENLWETRYLYPDLCAVCGEPEFERGNRLLLLNPILVIEVTSPSSLVRDRSDKRDYYFDVPSIRDYLIIDQHRAFAELNRRAATGWTSDDFSGIDEVIHLPALDCQLPLEEVYRGVQFDNETV